MTPPGAEEVSVVDDAGVDGVYAGGVQQDDHPQVVGDSVSALEQPGHGQRE